MAQYDLGQVVGDKGDEGNGIASITKTGTSGLVDTYTITYDDGDTDTFTVTNGSNATVDIVTAFSSTTSDSKVPSEKLTKTELDKKVEKSNTTGLLKNDGTVDTNTYLTSHQDISGKLDIAQTSSKGKNVVVDSTSGDITFEDKYTHPSTKQCNYSYTHPSAKQCNASIPSSSSDLSDGSDLIKKSNTSGLVKNDGSIDTTSYSTFSGSYNDLSNKPSIPSKTSDLTNDSNFISTSNTAGLLKNDGTVDTTSYSTFSGSYSDLTNKPSIPSASTDLSDSANLIRTSNTTGLIKNDGSIDTTSYSTFTGSYSDLTNKPSYTATITSSSDGAVKIGSTDISGSSVDLYCQDKMGMRLKTSATNYTAIDTGYRYRIWLETTGGKLMPVNTSTSTSSNANKSSYMNTRDFYLNGRIFYSDYNGTTNADSTLSDCYIQRNLTLGFSFNNTGVALSLTNNAPVYMIAENRGNGMARLTSPYFTQTLPSTEDNKLYIYLGHSISETEIELALNHPIYEYKNSSLQLYNDNPEIADNLTTNNANKVLSAKQGYNLKSWLGEVDRCLSILGAELCYRSPIYSQSDDFVLFGQIVHSNEDGKLCYLKNGISEEDEIATMGDLNSLVGDAITYINQ